MDIFYTYIYRAINKTFAVYIHMYLYTYLLHVIYIDVYMLCYIY